MAETSENRAETGEKGKKKLRILLRTFGCQMNVRDSEVIAGLLMANGYHLTANPGEADIVIFNTCAVRQHAEDKVWSEAGRFKRRAARNVRCKFSPNTPEAGGNLTSGAQRLTPIIGVIGCMAQEHKDKIFERSPNVDFVAGPGDIQKIPEIIKKVSGIKCQASGKSLYETKVWETDGQVRPEEIYHSGFYQDKEHAYVVISEGCSNYCSYCVVPYVRGTLRHRGHEDILGEIEEAAARGITKITLLGQNVNAYLSNSKEVNFIDLLKKVNKIEDLKEFSFITSHPKDTTAELFKAMSECGKLKKYLHLPVQSGSDSILKAMNRNYTRKFYLDSIDKYRKIVKAGGLTTDIIVGFPGESEEDFQETCDLVKVAQFDAAYIFKYSPRPNTGASKMVDDLPVPEKERRHRIILELQKRISNKIKTQR